MKRFYIIIVVFCCLTFSLATISLLQMTSPYQNTEDVNAIPPVNSPIVSETASKSKVDKMLEQRQKLQRLAIQSIYKTGSFTGANTEDALLGQKEEISHEERERRKKQWKKIADVFFSDQGTNVIQEILEEEKPDPQWSNEVNKYVLDLLQRDQLTATRIHSVDCRERLCKLVLRHENEDAFNDFQQQAGNTGPWESDQYGKVDEIEDEMQTSIYFSKDIGDSSPFVEFRDRLEQIIDDETTDLR